MTEASKNRQLANPYVRQGVNVLWIAVACVVLEWSGLFGVREATTLASRDVFYRAWSVAYPREMSPRTNVILMSDSSLGGGYWPAPYEKHAALVRALIPFHIKALLIDIGMFDERPDATIANFKQALIDLSSTGTKIYLTVAAPDTGATRAVRSDLAALADAGAIQLVSAHLGQRSGEAYAYPLVDRSGWRPAALAMCRDARRCPDTLDINEFEVWWAAPPAPINCRLLIGDGENTCNDISQNVIIRLGRLLFNWSLGENLGNWHIREQDPILLPYSPTAQWEEVVADTLPKEFQEGLGGSFVFYGLNLAMIRDDVFSPVNGQGDQRGAPGVFFHAMAFDNLAALGNGVIRQATAFGLPARVHSAAVVVLCCLGLYLVRASFIRLRFTRGAWLTDHAVVGLIAILIAAFEFIHLHISPSNWIGVISLVALSNAAGFADWLTNRTFWCLEWLGITGRRSPECRCAKRNQG